MHALGDPRESKSTVSSQTNLDTRMGNMKRKIAINLCSRSIVAGQRDAVVSVDCLDNIADLNKECDI